MGYCIRQMDLNDIIRCYEQPAVAIFYLTTHRKHEFYQMNDLEESNTDAINFIPGNEQLTK